jgi:hypothetical protein
LTPTTSLLYFSCVFSRFHVSFILIILTPHFLHNRLQRSPEAESHHAMSRPRRGVQPQKYVIEDSDEEEENELNAGSEELSPFEESDVSCHISSLSYTC